MFLSLDLLFIHKDTCHHKPKCWVFLLTFLFIFQDKTVKSTVFKIVGSIPAGNYIQLPKTSSQSLGLTGRYMYLMIKPIPTKYFVVHIDVATQDNLVVRISFSNLFKEFKSTSTWLQFPFVCKATRGSVHAVTALNAKGNEKIHSVSS